MKPETVVGVPESHKTPNDTRRKHDALAKSAIDLNGRLIFCYLIRMGYEHDLRADFADPRGDNDGGFFLALEAKPEASDDHVQVGIYRVNYGSGERWSAEVYQNATGNASTVEFDDINDQKAVTNALVKAMLEIFA
jgi:hypothetical protein